MRRIVTFPRAKLYYGFEIEDPNDKERLDKWIEKELRSGRNFQKLFVNVNFSKDSYYLSAHELQYAEEQEDNWNTINNPAPDWRLNLKIFCGNLGLEFHEPSWRLSIHQM